ncbi:hypothetical protein [Nocardiopsis sp. JB363]|uniref:hypothetical protein n=1 Tax=Nocardiopsis sp. JB363 TaxID=1434837 RepID=UPI00097B74F5|nr:hypothetical protein [Nocardiopsis sp. JB363]SIO88595.1 hypothetical protein BQ8420_19415 [Nocardiopsis sp. JB363]
MTSYAGQATDLPTEVFASQPAAIEDGSLPVILAGTYHGLEQVGQAQQGLETGVRPGKHVVVLD